MYGRGTFSFEDGSEYVGMFNREYEHGHGIWTDKQGNQYNGNWIKGVKDGQGTFVFANGDKYVGEWRDNAQHGQGKLIKADGTREEGFWEEGVYVGIKDPVASDSEDGGDEEEEADADAAIQGVIDKLWNTYDADGSGALDKQESRQFVEDTLGNLGSDKFDGAAFDELFMTFDKDASGTVEKSEMFVFIKQLMGWASQCRMLSIVTKSEFYLGTDYV